MAAPEKSPTTETDPAVAGPTANGHAPPMDEETRPVSAIDTPTPLPLPTPLEAYERFETVFDGVQAPFAFLDLDAIWANAADMLRRSRGKPIRIASIAIRSRPVLERLLDLDPGFQGALTYTLPETLWLWERGRARPRARISDHRARLPHPPRAGHFGGPGGGTGVDGRLAPSISI